MFTKKTDMETGHVGMEAFLKLRESLKSLACIRATGWKLKGGQSTAESLGGATEEIRVTQGEENCTHMSMCA